jgi:hypothetical protein
MAKVSKQELVHEVFIFLDDRGVEDASEMANELVDELIESVAYLDKAVKDDLSEDADDEEDEDDILDEDDYEDDDDR